LQIDGLMQHKVALIVYYAPQDKAKDDEDEDTMEQFIGAFKHKIEELRT